MNLEILNSGDSAWRSYYDRLGECSRDVFFSPGFAELCQQTINHNHSIRCAAFVSGEQVILYPFIERQLSKVQGQAFKDITGLYGRGGITTDARDTATLSQFYAEFQAYCRENSIICGFDRFHPAIGNHVHAPRNIQLMEVGQFVIVDLSANMDEVERRFCHAQRKSIKKAERAGVEVFYQRGLDHLDEFLKIYHSVLDRRHADRFYYFPEEFYRGLPEKMPGNFVFFYAQCDSRLVSCELVLFEGIYCHSYLGGTLFEYKDVCPNALLKREIIRYFKNQNCRFFLLGGGQTANDGIFRYKSGFSPEGAVPSYVGGTIYDQEAYHGLREKLTASGLQINTNHFQFYDPVLIGEDQNMARKEGA